MARPIDNKKYSFYYSLSKKESEMFIILLNRHSKVHTYNYALSVDELAFTLSLLASLNNNVIEMLRILNSGYNILPRAYFSKIISLCKESIVLVAIEDTKFTKSELLETTRFIFAEIDRNTLNRILKKYDISYK